MLGARPYAALTGLLLVGGFGCPGADRPRNAPAPVPGARKDPRDPAPPDGGPPPGSARGPAGLVGRYLATGTRHVLPLPEGGVAAVLPGADGPTLHIIDPAGRARRGPEVPPGQKVISLRTVARGRRTFLRLRMATPGTLTDLYWDPARDRVVERTLPYRASAALRSALFEPSTPLCVAPPCPYPKLIPVIRALEQVPIPVHGLDLDPDALAALTVQALAKDQRAPVLWFGKRARTGAYENEMRILEGSFTAPGRHEAVASLYGGGTSHHDQWQAWLLAWEGTRWRLVRRLEVSCGGAIGAVDVEGDGRSELLVATGCTHQGEHEGTTRVVALTPEGSRALYSATSVDRRGAARAGDAARIHRLRFWDVDGDGTLELVDSETSWRYDWTGKPHESSYLERGHLVRETVHRLVMGQYRPWRPPTPRRRASP